MTATPLLVLLLLAAPLAACAIEEPTGGGRSEELTVGGRCEGCEAVFQGRPATLGWEARIAPPGEPGEPMLLEGVVRRLDGAMAQGIIVYAYHTDAAGLYPTNPRPAGRASGRHGRLRGFARTDEAGRYRFETIRPAGYPGTDIPQHVHLHVVEPGRCTYYLDDVVFTDDPRLTPANRPQYEHGRGGGGVVTPTRDAEGRWRARRDIVLGQGIADYERCGPAPKNR